MEVKQGSAKGTLKVDNNNILLKYAYAHQYDNEEGMLDGPELRILLADRKVPQSLISGFDGPSNLDSWTRVGKILGVLLKVDPKKVDGSVAGTLLCSPPDPQGSLIFFADNVQNKVNMFNKTLKIQNNLVLGEARYQYQKVEDLPSFDFAVSFSAPLFHDEKITARLIGKKAIESPQVQALLLYNKAVREGNLDHARQVSTAADKNFKELNLFQKQASEQAFQEMIKETFPEDKQLQKQIKEVVVRDSKAVIIAQVKGGKTATTVVLVDGQWKLQAM